MPSTPTSRIVLIIAKRPRAGSSKTRLAPLLGTERAAKLSECFVLDAISMANDAATVIGDCSVAVAGTPPEDEPWFLEHAPSFIAQVGEDLGPRLAHVIDTAFDRGHRHVIAINSDSPTLPPDRVTEAFAMLDDGEVDAVFGPAADGGYYLIGCGVRPGRLVTEPVMSTPTVLDDTLAVARELGLTTRLLSPWFDVDEPADFERLRREVADGAPCGPQTKRFLQRLEASR